MRPCPFCGAQPDRLLVERVDGYVAYVQCINCTAEGPPVVGHDGASKEQLEQLEQLAIDLWNKRA